MEGPKFVGIRGQIYQNDAQISSRIGLSFKRIAYLVVNIELSLLIRSLKYFFLFATFHCDYQTGLYDHLCVQFNDSPRD